jgi:hypothetical protein
MDPKDVEVIEKPENGTLEQAEQSKDLTADEKKWLVGLLSVSQVCAVLTSPMDKAFAANIQNKLGE